MTEICKPTHCEIQPFDMRTFVLSASRAKVNIDQPESGQFPTFLLYLNRTDERFLGCNLLLRLDDFSRQCKNAVISITQIQKSPDGLKLEEVHQEEDILYFGKDAELVLRRFRPFRGDGPIFFMAARKDLRIISPERLAKLFSLSFPEAP